MLDIVGRFFANLIGINVDESLDEIEYDENSNDDTPFMITGV
jgi:hypothetical protein